VITIEFDTKIDPFFQILLAGCELSTNGEIPTPGTAATRHAYFELRLKLLRKESPADFLQSSLKVLIDSVTDDVKEAELTASFLDICYGVMIFYSRNKRAYVNDW